ncbi:protein of unknown function [Candidatus Methylomirabilis oxygeniifera]|uniref:Uncharacterized protein n=1 Tax=Methylomirabilis oxygeniifera TaxID=671143 RepID=D5MHD1_METO1|nr:protein of unknown function [Candidatus Methylomirabilis oxyfera]
MGSFIVQHYLTRRCGVKVILGWPCVRITGSERMDLRELFEKDA